MISLHRRVLSYSCRAIAPSLRCPPMADSPPLQFRHLTSFASSDSKKSKPKHAKLLVHGPDSKGIVASLSQILFDGGCGIVDSASELSTDGHRTLFFQRIVFDFTSLDHPDSRTNIETLVGEKCREFGMKSSLNWGNRRKRVAIMVGRYDHCLWELLLRHRAGELNCDITAIISNHPDLQPVADTFG